METEAKPAKKAKETKKKGPWGGPRPNARGRPRKASLDERDYPVDVLMQCKANPTLTPLEYMLAVMRNPEIDSHRRDRMAIAAAPYVHGKKMDTYVGKKETAEEQSKTAAEAWMEDLKGTPDAPFVSGRA